MDTQYIESLVPITSRPYLRQYLRMEKVETDKELLAVILPLIPYDDRADLVFKSFLQANIPETDVVKAFMIDKSYIIEQMKVFFKIDARLDDITKFLDRFVIEFKNNKDELNTLIQRGIKLHELFSTVSISQEYEENKENLNKLTKFYEDEVMVTYTQYLELYQAINK